MNTLRVASTQIISRDHIHHNHYIQDHTAHTNINYSKQLDLVAQSVVHWRSKPKVAGSILTAVKQTFQLAWCGNTVEISSNVSSYQRQSTGSILKSTCNLRLIYKIYNNRVHYQYLPLFLHLSISSRIFSSTVVKSRVPTKDSMSFKAVWKIGLVQCKTSQFAHSFLISDLIFFA